jgi:pyruvate,water dikinase
MLQQTYTAHRRDTGAEVPFPVTWHNAGDADRSWRWDAEHSPFPVTPFSQEFSRGMGGPVVAIEALGGEAPGAQSPPPLANGYRYGRERGGAFMSQSPAYLENMARMAPRVDELWERGWRTEIEAWGREVSEADYASLSTPELVERIKSFLPAMGNHMVLMFKAAHLVNYSRSPLLEFCAESLGRQEADDLVTTLLQGWPSDSVASGAALWDVARHLRASPELLRYVDGNREDFDGVAAMAGGTEFAAEFTAWLERYGHRNGSFVDLAEPTLYEEPHRAVRLLLEYVNSPDPRESQKKAVAARETAQREFETRLGNDAAVVRFRELLTQASPYLAVREGRDHAVNRAFTAVRVPALILGRRLVERGAIEDPGDVFYLYFQELEAAAADTNSDLRSLARERRESMEYWRNVSPPPVIGGKQEADNQQDGVRGIGASAGKVTGTARVIMTLDQADRLRAGDVLVTRATTPAWTLLFASAAAVVTEGGGLLSHCAIVAREYGIPAVVGAAGAAMLIPDGAQVTVDGAQGRVTVH